VHKLRGADEVTFSMGADCLLYVNTGFPGLNTRESSRQ